MGTLTISTDIEKTEGQDVEKGYNSSCKAYVLLTQMHREKNLENSKPGFCLQNPGAGSSAGGLRAASFSFYSRPSREKQDFVFCGKREGDSVPLTPANF